MTSSLKSECEKGLERIAEFLRLSTPRLVQLEPDGSGSPVTLAICGALSAFPMPTEVLLIDTNGVQNLLYSTGWWSLVRFDLNHLGTNTVRFAAELPAADLRANQSLLSEHFGIDNDEWFNSICNLNFLNSWDDHFYSSLVPFDIRTQHEQYANELATRFVHDPMFREVFERKVDFNAKYNLKADVVLNEQDFLKIDVTTSYFTNGITSLPFAIEERQQNIANIQLIPQVPESVRRVVHWAKRVYVFGYFEYGFFTVSKALAYSALEAALHARWSAALPSPTILRHQKNSTIEEITLERSGHASIKNMCKVRKWNVRNLFVNGEKFPYTATMLLDSLRSKNIITDWQKRRYKDTWLELRNYHSHLEVCPIHSPDASTLQHAVEEINQLFDSLPTDYRTSN